MQRKRLPFAVVSAETGGMAIGDNFKRRSAPFLAKAKRRLKSIWMGTEKYVLASQLLELTAARRMSADLKFAEEPEDPIEPDDSGPDVDRDDERLADGPY